MEATSTMTQEKHEDKLTYDDKVIKKIAEITANEIDGIVTTSNGIMGSLTDTFRGGDSAKGIKVEVGEQQVAINLNVVCEYGKNIPSLFKVVQDQERRAISAMTGLDTVEVDMNVEDVLSKDDLNKLRNSQGAVPNLFNKNKEE